MKRELKRKIKSLSGETSQQWPYEDMVTLPDVLRVIDQLDEPEALSIDREQLIKMIENYIPLHDKTVGDVVDGILEIVKQLPEMEVLSPKWINEHAKAVAYDGVPDETEVVYVDELENLIIPKQELPVMPKYVAEYLDYVKERFSLIQVLEMASRPDELPKFKKENVWISSNDETFARAWLDGFMVEEEPLYRARLKVITDKFIASYLRTQFSGNENRLKELEIGNKYIHENYRHLSEFTENELKKLGIWDSDQWIIEEVEE